jgi:2-iminoacetate synthase ThiH
MKRGKYSKSKECNKSLIVRLNEQECDKLKILSESYNMSINSIMRNLINHAVNTGEIPYIQNADAKKRTLDTILLKEHGIGVIKLTEEEILDDLDL